jgi:hypothetical protein
MMSWLHLTTTTSRMGTCGYAGTHRSVTRRGSEIMPAEGQASTTTATDQREAGWPSFAHQRSGDQDISSQYKPPQQSVKEQVLPASSSHAPALAASASSIAPPVSSSCAQPLPMAARRCSATARRSNGRVKCARSQRGPFPAGRPAARNDTRRQCRGQWGPQ